MSAAFLRRVRPPRRLLLALGAAAVVVAAVWVNIRPSNDRDWALDHARLANPSFDGSRVQIENVRRFDHCPESGDTVRRWESRAFDLSDLDTVWLVLSPFERDWRGPAHPFLSFGFGDTAFVAVSVEARREKAEDYSMWLGLLKRYELTYVIADERDVIPLRVLCRDDDVYVYPIRATPEAAQALFREMLAKTNRLAERPEFYHTLWNNCATTVLAHANDVSTTRIPGGWRVLVPGYTDEIVHSLDLIDTEGTLEEARARFLVNERVHRFAGRPDLPARIRRSPEVSADGPAASAR